MGCVRRHVLNSVNIESMCHITGSIHPHKGSIEVRESFRRHTRCATVSFRAWTLISAQHNYVFYCRSDEPHKMSKSPSAIDFPLPLPFSVAIVCPHLFTSLFSLPRSRSGGENVVIPWHRYGRWVTRRVAVATIITIWLLAALVSFVPISFSLHRPDQPLVFEDNGRQYLTCALDLTPTYAVVSSCISFYVPCIVMIGIYCRYVGTRGCVPGST